MDLSLRCLLAAFAPESRRTVSTIKFIRKSRLALCLNTYRMTLMEDPSDIANTNQGRHNRDPFPTELICFPKTQALSTDFPFTTLICQSARS